MIARTEYAVLQFVEQTGYCHTVHAVVQGCSVMEYAKEGVRLEKRKVIDLAGSLIRQLESYYKCEEKEAYGYVNPYAIIVTEEGEARLLDAEAQENAEVLAKMQKKRVRMLFVSPEYVLSQRKRREDDLYGFGKTVQFLAEKCCAASVFTWREEQVLRKLYAHCLTGQKASLEEWKKIDKLLQKVGKRAVQDVKQTTAGQMLRCLAMLVIGLLAGKICFSDPTAVSATQQSDAQKEIVELQEALGETEDALETSQAKLEAAEQYGEMLEARLLENAETEAAETETAETEEAISVNEVQAQKDAQENDTEQTDTEQKDTEEVDTDMDETDRQASKKTIGKTVGTEETAAE